MSSSDDAVGYGKPPKHSRFQKGKSGNPNGKPQGSKSIPLLVGRSLGKKITVTIDGRSKRLTIAEAIAIQLVKKALSGDARTVMQVIQLQGVAEQLTRALEKEVLDNLNFEEMSMEQLDKIIRLTASPELLKAVGIEEAVDMKIARKFLSGRRNL